ncbi:MAG TPA: GNAT family N-acetyltransferase [Gammaproteobacteria bacterium]|nr:GNAT family N-acetyltransferase [Gammaproteobacteria bacterium]
MYTTRLQQSITEIDRGRWEALAEPHLYLSYGWLKTVEQSGADLVTPTYFSLEKSGQLLAGAACYESHAGNPHDLLNGFMLGRLERAAGMLGISFKPAFLCGPIRGSGEHLMLEDGLSPRERMLVLSRMVEAIEEEARRRRLPLFFTNVSEEERELREVLGQRGYNWTTVHPKNRLDIKWGSFDEYLADRETISSKNRCTFRNQIKRNRKAGVTYRELESIEQEDQLYALLCDHYHRLNHRPFPYRSNFLSAVKKNLGRDVIILVAEKEGRIIGVETLFHRGVAGWTSFIGLDHEASKRDFTYFVLAYCKSIEYGIRRGMRHIDFGGMMYRVKRRRGCTVGNSYIYHRGQNALAHGLLRPWFRFHRLWFEKYKIPGLLKK